MDWHVVVHLATVLRAWMGLAFVGMPYGFARAGWAASTVVLIAAGLASAHCAALLVQCKHVLRARRSVACSSYADVVTLTWGTGAAALDAALFFTTYGFCVSYCMYLLHSWGPDALHALLLTVVLAPMMFVEDIARLGPSSVVGSSAMFVALLLCFYAFDWRSLLTLWSGAPRIAAVDLPGLPVFVGMATTATCGIGFVLPFEESLQRAAVAAHPPGGALQCDHSPQVAHYYLRLLWSAVALCCAILVSFGLLGAQTYGRGTLAVVTLNMDPGAWTTAATTAALCVSVLAVCPLQFVVLRTVSEQHLLAGRSAVPLVRALWRLAMVASLVWVALHFPDFGLLSGFVGALGGSLLSFIVPLLCYLKLQRGHVSHRHWLLHVALLLLCTAAMVVATLVSISEIWERLMMR